MLSVLMQVFYTVCIVVHRSGWSTATAWPSPAARDFIGGFSKAFLAGVTPNRTAATFSVGVVIPEFVYICLPDDVRGDHRRR